MYMPEYTTKSGIFIQIPMDSSGFQWILIDSRNFDSFRHIPQESYGFWWILVDSTRFQWILSCWNLFHRIPVDSIGFQWTQNVPRKSSQDVYGSPKYRCHGRTQRRCGEPIIVRFAAAVVEISLFSLRASKMADLFGNSRVP